MPLKIIRNDITKMDTEAIVNTANEEPYVGSGCDVAIYNAAGYDELLKIRKNVGHVNEGEAFITPGFMLKAQYIIHTVSPLYIDGNSDEEVKLRLCYRNTLKLAKEYNLKSISFPLISTGSFGYPNEEGMRIAVDEINAFLLSNKMDVFLVVFDDESTRLGEGIFPRLEAFIDDNYVDEASYEEYGGFSYSMQKDHRIDDDSRIFSMAPMANMSMAPNESLERKRDSKKVVGRVKDVKDKLVRSKTAKSIAAKAVKAESVEDTVYKSDSMSDLLDYEYELNDRIKHLSDTFSQYLLYLIERKGYTNADVYKAAIVDKKVFSKIKNNPNYHPQKITALCLCIGAKLNIDDTRDLLARAGYALSPCDKTDIIFRFFIENEIYDMIELDIQLEAHGLPCIIQ